jgi:hypothetical protein
LSGDGEKNYLLRYDAVSFGRSSMTFQGNELLPSSGPKSKLCKQQVARLLLTLRPWSWRQYIPPKCCWTTRLHNIKSQKMVLFRIILYFSFLRLFNDDIPTVMVISGVGKNEEQLCILLCLKVSDDGEKHCFEYYFWHCPLSKFFQTTMFQELVLFPSSCDRKEAHFVGVLGRPSLKTWTWSRLFCVRGRTNITVNSSFKPDLPIHHDITLTVLPHHCFSDKYIR